MNWKLWLKSLAAVAIGGAATGAADVIGKSGQVDSTTGVVAGIGALGTVLAYLIKSPLQLKNAQVQVVVTPKTEEKK